jgi:hypothetical protein
MPKIVSHVLIAKQNNVDNAKFNHIIKDIHANHFLMLKMQSILKKYINLRHCRYCDQIMIQINS